MKVPKFLFFDLGRVLLDFDHEIAVQQLAGLADCDQEGVRDFVFRSPLQSAYEKGELSTAEFCARFRDHFDVDTSDARICHAASDIFTPNLPMLDIVRTLSGQGRSLGILSNTCDAHWQFICDADYDLLQHCPTQVLSFQVRASKPHARIYQVAAQQAQQSPGDIFFVDDLPENVAGAREIGLDAVLYTTPEQLRQQLIHRGIQL